MEENTEKKPTLTEEEKKKLLDGMKEYVEISNQIAELEKKKESAKKVVKSFFKGDEKEIVCGNYVAQLRPSATKTLRVELIKAELGVDVTDACYKITHSTKTYIFEKKEDEEVDGKGDKKND